MLSQWKATLATQVQAQSTLSKSCMYHLCTSALLFPFGKHICMEAADADTEDQTLRCKWDLVSAGADCSEGASMADTS